MAPVSSTYNPQNMVEFDLTDYALTQYGKGLSAISLYIDQNVRATNGKGFSQFASKENAEALTAPRLVSFSDVDLTRIHSSEAQGESASFTVKDHMLYLTVHKEPVIISCTDV